RRPRHRVAVEHLEVRETSHGSGNTDQGLPLELHARRASQGHAPHRPSLPLEEGDDPVPGREDAAQPSLSRPARAAPLRERRGALHRLQAVRGGLPGAGDHDRERRPRRRLAPDDALRHRPHQVHLLRLLRGELPGRLDRRDPHPRVPRRKARRFVLHQGHAARRRRSLRKRDRRGEGGGREIPLTPACRSQRRAGATRRLRTMVTNTALFYVFSGVLLLAAFRVITARSPVYAALFLVLAFFSAACVWILLRAELLVCALFLVSVGALMVLFLFVVMTLDDDVGSLRAGFWRHFPVAV